MAMERSLEIRNVPLVFETQKQMSATGGDPVSASVISNLYTHLSTNWLYTATIQLTLNGSQPSWSRDGWSFVPMDTTSLANTRPIQHIGNTSFIPATNVTVSTPAIRGRIDCSPYENLNSNISAWLTTRDLTNSSVWNVTSNPKGVSTGYELGTNPNQDYSTEFLDTTFFSNPARIVCCTNSTEDPTEGSAIGYWSSSNEQPFWEYEGPINISTKWIYGDAVSGFHRVEGLNERLSSDADHFIFRNVPEITALRCIPIIETADADVTVERETGNVQSFSIAGEPKAVDDVWSEAFVLHKQSIDPAKQYLVNSTTR